MFYCRRARGDAHRSAAAEHDPKGRREVAVDGLVVSYVELLEEELVVLTTQIIGSRGVRCMRILGQVERSPQVDLNQVTPGRDRRQRATDGCQLTSDTCLLCLEQIERDGVCVVRSKKASAFLQESSLGLFKAGCSGGCIIREFLEFGAERVLNAASTLRAQLNLPVVLGDELFH